MVTVHATCIAFDGKGILLRGPPGSGKSDLAIRAIADGARLVADDRVELALNDGRILASAPASIRGMIEVRGLGILRIEADTQAPVALVADLGDASMVERLPERRCCELMGLDIPWLALAPFESSALAKLRLALLAAAQPERLAP